MDDTLSDGTLTAPANPALVAATAEYQKAMTDPTHPHYEGLRRGDKSANDYISGLYRKALPNNAPVPIESEGVSITTGGPDDPGPSLSPEDIQAVESLQQEWGSDYETHLSAARFGSSRLTQALGASVDDLTAAVLDAGGDLKLILKIASHFEQRMRGHEQGPRP